MIEERWEKGEDEAETATLQKHKLTFYQRALLLALPGGQRHLKAKLEVSYL